MATKKVSALSALTSPDGAEELLINDGGTSKKITITNVSKLNLKGGDLASASPLVIDTDGNYFDVTGTTNFAAMTVAANRQFTLQFDGILTMTHHATNLDLPSEANITTAAGDVATFQSTGANTVQCICYTKADGTAVAGAAVDVSSDTTPQLGGDLDCNGSQIQWSQGADVASDTALAVLTDGNYFDVTGTTAITSINTTGGVGTLIKLHFDGVLVLTHDATDLILPGGANITTAAGDEAEFIEYATGDYRCTNYSKADGTAVVDANTEYTAGSLLDLSTYQFNVDLSELTDGTADVVGSADELVYLDASSQKRKQIDEIKLGQFDNDQSWTANTGTMTDVVDDTSPQLGGFLDANGNYIQMQKGGDIASASPTVIDTDGDYFICTGTTGFSAMTVAADRHFFLEFAAALTMTHGAGTLDLPGGANITTAASDVGEFYSTASNTVTCVNYTKADGTPIAGGLDLTADQSWSGSQRGTPSTVTDGTLDLDTANNFQYTPGGADTLEFSNEEAGQSGFVKLINPSAHAISVGSEVKKGSSWDVSTAGTYLVSYYCDGTNVYVSASEALS